MDMIWLSDIATNAGFQFFAGVASIISLIISAYLVWRIRGIHEQILLQVSVPKLVKELRDKESELRQILEERDEALKKDKLSNKAKSVVAELSVTLKSLRKNRRLREFKREINETIDGCRICIERAVVTDGYFERDLDRLKVKLVTVRSGIGQFIDDEALRPR